MLAEGGISFLDVGTSGGIWGLTEGYSLMVGGDPEVYSALEPIFRALAPVKTGATATWGRQVQATSSRWCTMPWNTG